MLEEKCEENQIGYHFEKELHHFFLILEHDVLRLSSVKVEAEVVHSNAEFELGVLRAFEDVNDQDWQCCYDLNLRFRSC